MPNATTRHTCVAHKREVVHIANSRNIWHTLTGVDKWKYEPTLCNSRSFLTGFLEQVRNEVLYGRV